MTLVGKALIEFNPLESCELAFHKNQSSGLKHVNECGVILFNATMDAILLVFQRISHKWGLPKGHMTFYELRKRDFYNCAKRELFEETNIDLRRIPHTKFGTLLMCNKLFYIIGLKRHSICAFARDTEEISQLKWVNRHDLYDFVHQNSCNITLRTLF